jgi:hypothetical protein
MKIHTFLAFIFLCISFLFVSCDTNVKHPLDEESSSSFSSNISSSSTTPMDSILEETRTPDERIQSAFENKENDLQVLVRGNVIRLLSDDTSGDQHQRFIIELSSGQTLLIAHNIDIGERVPDSMLGNEVYVYGVYEWNDEGGVIHWTHEDPDEEHIEGFIQFNGHKYQ